MRVTGGPRRWVAVTAIALCASALLTTGCGDSAADKEVACWAKYEALTAEIDTVLTMSGQILRDSYFEPAVTTLGSDIWQLRATGSSYYDSQRWAFEGIVVSHIRSQLPNC